MDQLPHRVGPPPVRSRTDYFTWAACSCAAFLVIGFVRWGGHPPISFWEECVRAAAGKRDVGQLAEPGLVLLAASCFFGRILHGGVAGWFGRLTKLPPDLVSDYADNAPRAPAG